MTVSDNVSGQSRRQNARNRRLAALVIADARAPLVTVENGEAEKYETKPTSFHKGLPHTEHGMPDAQSFAILRAELSAPTRDDSGYATFKVPLGPRDEDGRFDGDRGPDGVTTFVTLKEGGKPPLVRNWESPLGGHAYDVEGPDAGDLSMAPAPTLPFSELCAEMAEVYAMALLRDVPFSQFRQPEKAVVQYLTPADAGEKDLPQEDGTTHYTVADVIAQLNALTWFKRDTPFTPSYRHLTGSNDPTPLEKRRKRARFKGAQTALTPESLFRGSAPGAMEGPYISQFLLIGSRAGGPATAGLAGFAPDGSADTVTAAKEVRNIPKGVTPLGVSGDDMGAMPDGGAELGYVSFGAQRIDQRVNAHLPGRDHMTNFSLWLDVQNGADLKGTDSYYGDRQPRFIRTPRDMATFVHFDELYQAYFNACLLMFNFGVPFDYGFPSGRAHLTRGSFATFGGPHILSLMTEVASRALKAVRRQKFQHHLRGRPEQLAAMLTVAQCAPDALGDAAGDMEKMLEELRAVAPNLLTFVADHNMRQNRIRDEHPYFPQNDASHPFDVPAQIPDKHNFLLPMAFPEGSPMHAAYGAGHATVAGACVTMLKAFFEMSAVEIEASDNGTGRPVPDIDSLKSDDRWWQLATMGSGGFGLNHLYEAPDALVAKAHDKLQIVTGVSPGDVTIEGELNKLAANVSIGRNMAGVHYYTDYYDSLRMGERLAVGILEEQMTTYPDPVTMRLGSFDGDRVIISGDGRGNASAAVRVDGDWDGAEAWWRRGVADFQ